MIVLGLARGELDAQALAQGGGTGTFLILLPALIAFVAAVATARLLAPVLRAGERWGRRAPVPVRFAALSLARNPGYAAVAVTFLVVSLGLALFAQAYRQTLAQGEHAQADFAVPVDAVARENLQTLVPVLDAAPLQSYGKLGAAAPVLRLSGALSRVQAPFTVVGLPPDELARLRWRSDNASASPSTLAQQIRFDAPFGGLDVPANASDDRAAGARRGRSRDGQRELRDAERGLRPRSARDRRRQHDAARRASRPRAWRPVRRPQLRRHEQRAARRGQRRDRRADA